MRLIVKTSFWYFLLTLFVFGLGGVASFFLVRSAVQRETDWELVRDLREVKSLLENEVPLDKIEFRNIQITPLEEVNLEEYHLRAQKSHIVQDTLQRNTNNNTEITPLTYVNRFSNDATFSDTLIYLKRTGKMESFRKLSVIQPIRNQFYKLEIVNIIFEQDDIFDVVSQIVLRLFFFMILALIIGSILIAKQLLAPFEQLLHAIATFNIKSEQVQAMPNTNITEFQRIGSFLDRMMTKAKKDYQTLKEFTENASHEMQTPIAIAKGKLEILQQRNDLNEEQAELIEKSQHALSKLSKLSTALALLAKIENQEFISQESIDFSEVVSHNVALFSEIAELKELTIEADVVEAVKVNIDSALADILVANLLKNAIQHNIENGWIKIRLTSHQLLVENTGKPLNIPPEELFVRFRKNNQSSGSLGLGLAIVKKIADLNNLSIDYQQYEHIHRIAITLPNS